MKQAIFLLLFFFLGIFWVPGAGLSEASSLRIDLHRDGKRLELEEVLRVLEAGFQSLYPEKQHRIEVKAIHHYERIELPPGNLSCEIVLSEQAYRGGNISALLIFRTNGREIGKTRVSARVDLYTDVLVAAHYLRRHHEIEAKDLQWVSRSLSHLPPDFLTEMGAALGKRLTIALNRGEVLRKAIVEEPPLLKRGNRVMLLVETGQIRVTTVGEVREEGRRGDRIKLVNLSSKKEVIGRVIDGQTVQVDF